MRERHPEDKLWSSQEHAEDENAQMHITAMCLGREPVLADTALHTVRALGGREAGTQSVVLRLPPLLCPVTAPTPPPGLVNGEDPVSSKEPAS